MKLINFKRKFIILICAVSLCFIKTFAWSTASGETGMNFLKIAVGVRGIGMGEANTAVADDLGSLYWNPAGLANVKFVEMQFMYNKWFQDITSQYAAFSIPFRKHTPGNVYKNLGTIALSVNSLTIADIQGYDANGAQTGKLEASDIAVGLSYAHSLSNKLQFGFTAKHLSETLDGTNAAAYCADIGLLYKTFKGIGLGFAAQNLGTKIKFIEEEGLLPAAYRIGASYNRNIFAQSFLIAADIVMPNDNDTYFCTGLEYWIKDIIAFRTGFRSGLDVGEGLRLGAGFKTSMFLLDYAFAGFGELGDTHRISLSVRFGKGAQMGREMSMYNTAKHYYEEKQYSLAVIELNKLLKLNPANRKALDLLKKSYNGLEKSVKEAEAKGKKK
ncbi:PorV/PorQ family protein [bacterium]